MPMIGLAIEDQRSSSGFKIEEGRHVLTNLVWTRGTGKYNSDMCVLKISAQRLDNSGNAVGDETNEELNYGPLTKFHPGNAESIDTELDDVEDLGEDAEGNALYFVDKGARPTKTAKAAIWGASLQNAGVLPKALCGYLPALIGLDAKWFREVTKVTTKDGERDASNLIVKMPGAENIFNLSEINKRAGGAPSNGTAKSAAATAAKPKPTSAKASAPVESTDADDEKAAEIAAKGVEVLAAMTAKTEQTKTPAQVATMAMAKFAMLRVAPPLHKPIKAKILEDAEWFAETVDGLGWTVNYNDDGGVASVVIPAKQ